VEEVARIDGQGPEKTCSISADDVHVTAGVDEPCVSDSGCSESAMTRRHVSGDMKDEYSVLVEGCVGGKIENATRQHPRQICSN
jgi:hypothetical protein